MAATAAAVPAGAVGAAVLGAAPALADPTVTDGETRVVDVPLADVELVDADGAQVRDLPQQPGTMVGVTWPSEADAPEGQVRGKLEDGQWTEWEPLETAEDPETGEDAPGTEAAWVGVVGALQVRAELDGADVTESLTAHVITTSPTTEDTAVARMAGVPEPMSTSDQQQLATTAAAVTMANPATPVLGPGAPSYTSRAGWGANEGLVRGTSGANQCKAVVIHHTAGTNSYTSAESAQLVRGILTYHTQTLGWADIGYNVLVSKYGQIFEGRSGGLHRNITGAHAYGFNTGSFGISVMGNYQSTAVPSAARTAVARLVGWKLLTTFQTSATGTSSWTPGEGTRFPAGKTISLPKMFGHRDVNYTDCPGTALYNQFGTLRSEAQKAIDGGWKEHLWAFQGAGGAAKLGTVVKSAHRTGNYTATVLTKGLVLQESGNAAGYATPMAPQWAASWGRPAKADTQDGDRRIQVFQNGVAANEGGTIRFRTSNFRDVAPSRVFFLEINDLFAHRNKITEGWGTGASREFRPNEDNLRDAMIAFIYRAMGRPAYSAPKSSPFKDVPTSIAFYDEICWAYENGIANGWGSGANRTFRPFAPVQRDAVAAFLYRAAKANHTSTNNSFKDVPATHVFAKEITWLAAAGITRGWDDGTFRPNALIKRDQMATFMIRWMKHTGKY
jgi:uncharacterized protein with LGFP repeats